MIKSILSNAKKFNLTRVKKKLYQFKKKTKIDLFDNSSFFKQKIFLDTKQRKTVMKLNIKFR